jgi:predicted dehydrogenase
MRREGAFIMATRREFIQTTAAAAVGATLATSRALGANDRIRLGVIGSGGRGLLDMLEFLKNPGVEVTAVCDVWDEHRDKCASQIPNKPKEFQTYVDYRPLLDRKDIDAVLIATPDHWHMQPCIDACGAGKDVYIEKPLTFAVAEGKEMIKAARVHNRVVQCGMQQRSGEHYREAKERYFDTGKIGKVTLARTWWHGNSWHLRKAPFTAKPAGLDWDRFVGPRPWREFDAQQFWNWRAYLDFGGGQITDLFTHWIDVVQWFMKQDLPSAAVASGGVYAYKDGRTAPDTICVLLEYPKDWTATFEATLAPGTKGAAIEFVGTEGSLLISRGGYTWSPVKGEKVERKAPGEQGDALTQSHVRNFLECVRSRQRPNGDVAIGHRSALASHLGNIAYVEKRRIVLDPIREEVLPA